MKVKSPVEAGLSRNFISKILFDPSRPDHFPITSKEQS
jgi:hypothetical protein